MATPLNQFKTKTYIIQDKDATEAVKARGTDVVYTVPAGVSAIILMAQISNIANEFGVQSNDAVSPLTGKLVVQEGNQIAIWADQADKLELTLSFLESLNG